MVMKIFRMPEWRRCTSRMQMEQGCAMRRKRHTESFANGCRFEKAADATTAGCVCHYHINCPRIDHIAEISRPVSILSIRNLNLGRTSPSQKSHPLAIFRCQRLLHPPHIERFGKKLSKIQRRLQIISAISVDKKLRATPNGSPCESNPFWIDFRISTYLH